MIKKYGCIGALVVVGVLALSGLLMSWIAWRQIGTEAPQLESSEQSPFPDSSGPSRGRVTLDVEIANLIVLPAPAGAPIRLEADYDPARYRLEESFQPDTGDGFEYRLEFGPAGSEMWSLLRMKLGGVPPRLRIWLPCDVRIQLEGKIRRAIGTFELGGMSVETVKFRVESGAAAISVLAPTRQPMETFDLFCDKGSLKVGGLGNADPRVVDVRQHLGELDLDLRGAWSRGVEVNAGVYLAGGRLWLPDNVNLNGTDPATEVPLPIMNLEVVEKGGRLLIVDARPSQIPTP